MRGHGAAVIGVSDYHAAKARLEVGNACGKAQHRHHLACNRDVKAVLARNAVSPAAEAAHDIAQLPVVHVHGAFPRYLPRVDAEGVALMYMVIHHRGKQVVRRAYGVEIAGEVEVYVLHRDDLCVSAAGSAALDAEHRAETRLAQRCRRVFADAAQCVGKADRSRSLALARRSRRDGSDKNELAVRSVRQILQQRKVYLSLVASILLDIFFVYTHSAGYLRYRLHHAALGYLYIGLIFQ